jgi:phosphonate degradation associated HDIG domain protein
MNSVIDPVIDPAILTRIEQLFAQHGHQAYEGHRQEPVSALAHALQCAQLAEWAHADAPLVAAALLHDIGHFLAADTVIRAPAADDAHEVLAIPFLATGFDSAVTEPVRLHVQAKRFLVRVDQHYARQLSPASQHSLYLQGGPMDDDEIAAFEVQPFARDAVQLRRWDDLAKQADRKTPPLSYYLALLDELRGRPFADSKIDIAASRFV